MPKIFLSHEPPALENYYGPRALAALRELAEVVVNPTGRVIEGGELAELARGCAIVIADRQTPGEARFFAEAPDCVAFLRSAVDIRTIDVAAASRHGILVTRATASFAASVAELTLGLIVDCARGISDAVIEYRAGRMPMARRGRQLAGATLGIIGYGTIGRHLAPIGVALGMRVLVSDPYANVDNPALAQVPMDDLLGAADFVVCLAVATEETENLIGAREFGLMRPDTFFINVSRGNLVDEAALAAALDAKRIAGAALDVGRAPDQMPSPFLAARPDVIATPHIGGLTPQAIEQQAFDTVGQARALLAGEVPEGAVNLEAATRLSRLRTS